MDELEEIRKKRLKQLQQQQEKSLQQQSEKEKVQEQLTQLEFIVKQKLSKQALERYGNIKIAHPETATQLLLVIAHAINNNQVQEITDEQLKQIIIEIQPKNKDIKIKRK
ncbi:DNA-binding protein [Nanoarchaeota archaeon]